METWQGNVPAQKTTTHLVLEPWYDIRWDINFSLRWYCSREMMSSSSCPWGLRDRPSASRLCLPALYLMSNVYMDSAASHIICDNSKSITIQRVTLLSVMAQFMSRISGFTAGQATTCICYHTGFPILFLRQGSSHYFGAGVCMKEVWQLWIAIAEDRWRGQFLNYALKSLLTCITTAFTERLFWI